MFKAGEKPIFAINIQHQDSRIGERKFCKMIIKSPHKPVRSSMANFTNIIKDRNPFTIKDILREKRIKEELEEVRRERREKFRSFLSKCFPKNNGRRITIIRKVNGVFNGTGIGELPSKNVSEIRDYLKSFKNPEGKSFSHFKMGCVLYSVQEK